MSFDSWALAVVEVFVDYLGHVSAIDFGGVSLAWVLISLSVVSIVIRYLFGKG